MKKILLSLLSIGVVAVVALVATQAFFSDTEKSTGNTFVAGTLDLQVDNTSYAIDYNIPGFQNPVGNFIASTNTTWTQRDLTIEKFFDFSDLKPGDYGEDTISLHVQNNAWLCAAARLTQDDDETYTEPEKADDLSVDLNNPTTTNGELDEGMNFAFWVDDGDNVYEPTCPQEGECTPETIFLGGPLSGLGTQGKITIADAQNSVLGDANPIPSGTTFYIGKAWCFGTMTPTGLVQDGVNTGTPLTLGTGFDCDGTQVNNAAQSDKVVGDLEFYAEQSRNNETFDCDEGYTPSWVVQ